MLYPLSYEGLACTFAQHAGPVLIRWTRAGYLASDGLCPTCAAYRVADLRRRPQHAVPIVRMVMQVVPVGTAAGDGN